MSHNHVTRDIRPPGYCPACDEYHDKAMRVPVCYERHELAPGISQSVPHIHPCPDCKGHTFEHEAGCINE